MKATFDSILLNLLLAKLKNLDFGGYLLDWLGCYLSARSYKVRVSDSFSEKFIGLSGVSQGSVLSPLLFVFFVNGCVSVLPKNSCLLCADSVKIVLPVACCRMTRMSSWIFCLVLLQWSPLSPQKCSVISFGRSYHKVLSNNYNCGSQLVRVFSIKYLGVWLDEKLLFNLHVEFVLKKRQQSYGHGKARESPTQVYSCL